MIFLCEGCNKPIERINDIKLMHRNGCRIEPIQEPVKPEVLSDPAKEAFTEPDIEILPDGRMDAKQAAKYIGYSVSRLNAFRSLGGGPKYVQPGRKIFYYKTDLDDWLERNKVANTAQARFQQHCSKAPKTTQKAIAVSNDLLTN